MKCGLSSVTGSGSASSVNQADPPAQSRSSEPLIETPDAAGAVSSLPSGRVLTFSRCTGRNRPEAGRRGARFEVLDEVTLEPASRNRLEAARRNCEECEIRFPPAGCAFGHEIVRSGCIIDEGDARMRAAPGRGRAAAVERARVFTSRGVDPDADGSRGDDPGSD